MYCNVGNSGVVWLRQKSWKTTIAKKVVVLKPNWIPNCCSISLSKTFDRIGSNVIGLKLENVSFIPYTRMTQFYISPWGMMLLQYAEDYRAQWIRAWSGHKNGVFEKIHQYLHEVILWPPFPARVRVSYGALMPGMWVSHSIPIWFSDIPRMLFPSFFAPGLPHIVSFAIRAFSAQELNHYHLCCSNFVQCQYLFTKLDALTHFNTGLPGSSQINVAWPIFSVYGTGQKTGII